MTARDVDGNATADDQVAKRSPQHAPNTKTKRVRLGLPVVDQRTGVRHRDGPPGRPISQVSRHDDHDRCGVPLRQEAQHLGHLPGFTNVPVDDGKQRIDAVQGVDDGLG